MSIWRVKAAARGCRAPSRTSNAGCPNNYQLPTTNYQLRLRSGRYHGRCPAAVFDIARVGLKINRKLARQTRSSCGARPTRRETCRALDRDRRSRIVFEPFISGGGALNGMTDVIHRPRIRVFPVLREMQRVAVVVPE